MFRASTSIELGWTTGAESNPLSISAENATIVIPSFNQASRIVVLLERLAISFPLTHILVVDNCSQDGTQVLVSQYVKQKRGKVDLLERRGCTERSLCAVLADAAQHCGTPAIILLPPQIEKPQTLTNKLLQGLATGAALSIPQLASAEISPKFDLGIRRLFQLKHQNLGLGQFDPFSMALGLNTAKTKMLLRSLRALNATDDFVLLHLLSLLEPETEICVVEHSERLKEFPQFGSNKPPFRKTAITLLKHLA